MGKKLCIAEKPNAGIDYAKVLNCREKKEGYIEGDEYVVTWAVGHLLTLKDPGDYDEKYLKWRFEDLPIIPEKFELKLIKGAKKQYDIIKSLLKREDVDEVILGTDAGREGENIGRRILNDIGNKKPVKRLWVSSLTPEAIKKGFNDLRDFHQNDNLYEAAEARAIIDQLLGINASRGYTIRKVKDETYNGKNIVLSVGRCQTPVLNMIVERDLEIENFKSIPYFDLTATFESYNGKYTKAGITKIDKKEEAEEIKNRIEGQTGTIVSIEKKDNSVPPPQLFDLTALQMKMDEKYGYAPDKTLKIAQALYETHKVLSYPRTSSQHLSEDIFNIISKHLEAISFGEFKDMVENIDIKKLKDKKRFVDDTKIEDHHALVPTDNNNMEEIYIKLNEEEKNVFNQIIYSLICMFYPDYKYESIKILTNVSELEFISKGTREIQKGWKKILSDETEDEKDEDTQSIPELNEGDKKTVTKVDLKANKTKPQARYTGKTVLALMKKKGVGTAATRDKIIKTLFDREYVKKEGKNKIISTTLGRKFIDCIVSEELKSIELTAELEEKLEKIAAGKISKEEVLSEAIEMVKKQINDLKNSEGVIVNRKREILGTCPLCKEGNILEYREGYGCNKYKENGCKFGVKKIIGGKEISVEQIKKLIEKGETDIIRDIKGKEEGQTYNASFKIIDKKLQLIPQRLTCPICKKGIVRKYEKGYGCSEYKNGCKFFVGRIIANKEISDIQIEKLIIQGKTDLIKGLTKKDKDGFEEIFDAILIIKDGKLGFAKKKK